MAASEMDSVATGPGLSGPPPYLPGGSAAPPVKVTYHFTTTIANFAHVVSFDIDSNYVLEKLIGGGAYGFVAIGRDTSTGQRVAVKKVSNCFQHRVEARRVLRELKIQSVLEHDNIVQLYSIVGVPAGEAETFRDVYLVMEPMETNLERVINSEQDLSSDHISFFVLQIMKGLKYLHSANCLHRDLKPANLLLDADSNLKICDFGLARPDPRLDAIPAELTSYVVTRYYRAPEVICDRTAYGAPSDLWSVGMILAELYKRNVFLPGKDQYEQIALILDYTGKPSEELIERVRNPHARKFVSLYEPKLMDGLEDLFPEADTAALDLLASITTWDPEARLTAEGALEHPFLQTFRDGPDSETVADGYFTSFDFEGTDMDTDTCRRLIYEEIARYNPAPGEAVADPQTDVVLTADELSFAAASADPLEPTVGDMDVDPWGIMQQP